MIRGLIGSSALGVELIEGADHNQSYQILVDGKVDGFATDDVLLAGLLAQHHSQDKFAIVGTAFL